MSAASTPFNTSLYDLEFSLASHLVSAFYSLYDVLYDDILQPENLLVEQSNTSPQLKLVDFGDVQHIANTPIVHPLVGSPEFAAPEIVSGAPVGLTTDVW